LSIGNNFSVKWDGTLQATDGKFTGEINAKSGEISGDLDVSGTLTGGTFSGSIIYANLI
jgi:hypothetical protein